MFEFDELARSGTAPPPKIQHRSKDISISAGKAAAASSRSRPTTSGADDTVYLSDINTALRLTNNRQKKPSGAMESNITNETQQLFQKDQAKEEYHAAVDNFRDVVSNYWNEKEELIDLSPRADIGGLSSRRNPPNQLGSIPKTNNSVGNNANDFAAVYTQNAQSISLNARKPKSASGSSRANKETSSARPSLNQAFDHPLPASMTHNMATIAAAYGLAKPAPLSSNGATAGGANAQRGVGGTIPLNNRGQGIEVKATSSKSKVNTNAEARKNSDSSSDQLSQPKQSANSKNIGSKTTAVAAATTTKAPIAGGRSSPGCIESGLDDDNQSGSTAEMFSAAGNEQSAPNAVSNEVNAQKRASKKPLGPSSLFVKVPNPPKAEKASLQQQQQSIPSRPSGSAGTGLRKFISTARPSPTSSPITVSPVPPNSARVIPGAAVGGSLDTNRAQSAAAAAGPVASMETSFTSMSVGRDKSNTTSTAINGGSANTARQNHSISPELFIAQDDSELESRSNDMLDEQSAMNLQRPQSRKLYLGIDKTGAASGGAGKGIPGSVDGATAAGVSPRTALRPAKSAGPRIALKSTSSNSNSNNQNASQDNPVDNGHLHNSRDGGSSEMSDESELLPDAAGRNKMKRLLSFNGFSCAPWNSDDDVNLQQRPPSRQKSAFPIHLADEGSVTPPENKSRHAYTAQIQQHVNNAPQAGIEYEFNSFRKPSSYSGSNTAPAVSNGGHDSRGGMRNLYDPVADGFGSLSGSKTAEEKLPFKITITGGDNNNNYYYDDIDNYGNINSKDVYNIQQSGRHCSMEEEEEEVLGYRSSRRGNNDRSDNVKYSSAPHSHSHSHRSRNDSGSTADGRSFDEGISDRDGNSNSYSNSKVNSHNNNSKVNSGSSRQNASGQSDQGWMFSQRADRNRANSLEQPQPMANPSSAADGSRSASMRATGWQGLEARTCALGERESNSSPLSHTLSVASDNWDGYDDNDNDNDNDHDNDEEYGSQDGNRRTMANDMSLQTLESSLGADFLNLFAPG